MNIEPEQIEDDFCIHCGLVCCVYYEEKYKGWMGFCIGCNTQWRLS